MFYVLRVNVYCHRVPTQLQLTNISISLETNKYQGMPRITRPGVSGLSVYHPRICSLNNHGTTTWTDVSYGCKRWYLTLRQEHRTELSDRFQKHAVLATKIEPEVQITCYFCCSVVICVFLCTGCQWVRYCVTNRKVAVSIPDCVIGIFH
jgi:hypothetical protein